MVNDIFERLGGAYIVSNLMAIDYTTARRWQKNNYVPAHARESFIDMCKKHGVRVTYLQLSERNKNDAN